MVYGLSRLKLIQSSLFGSLRLSLLGHFCASRIVPTLLRFAPGTRYDLLPCSIRYEKGMPDVSGWFT